MFSITRDKKFDDSIFCLEKIMNLLISASVLEFIVSMGFMVIVAVQHRIIN